MTSPARSATTDITPSEALSMMIDGHFRHLPIVSGQGELLGILSIRHLLHWRTDDLSHELDALEQYFANDSLGVRFARGIERRDTKAGPLRWTRKKEEQEKLDRLFEELRSSATPERLCRGSRKLAQPTVQTLSIRQNRQSELNEIEWLIADQGCSLSLQEQSPLPSWREIAAEAAGLTAELTCALNEHDSKVAREGRDKVRTD